MHDYAVKDFNGTLDDEPVESIINQWSNDANEPVLISYKWNTLVHANLGSELI